MPSTLDTLFQFNVVYYYFLLSNRKQFNFQLWEFFLISFEA